MTKMQINKFEYEEKKTTAIVFMFSIIYTVSEYK